MTEHIPNLPLQTGETRTHFDMSSSPLYFPEVPGAGFGYLAQPGQHSQPLPHEAVPVEGVIVEGSGHTVNANTAATPVAMPMGGGYGFDQMGSSPYDFPAIAALAQPQSNHQQPIVLASAQNNIAGNAGFYNQATTHTQAVDPRLEREERMTSPEDMLRSVQGLEKAIDRIANVVVAEKADMSAGEIDAALEYAVALALEADRLGGKSDTYRMGITRLVGSEKYTKTGAPPVNQKPGKYTAVLLGDFAANQSDEIIRVMKGAENPTEELRMRLAISPYVWQFMNRVRGDERLQQLNDPKLVNGMLKHMSPAMRKLFGAVWEPFQEPRFVSEAEAQHLFARHMEAMETERQRMILERQTAAEALAQQTTPPPATQAANSMQVSIKSPTLRRQPTGTTVADPANMRPASPDALQQVQPFSQEQLDQVATEEGQRGIALVRDRISGALAEAREHGRTDLAKIYGAEGAEKLYGWVQRNAHVDGPAARLLVQYLLYEEKMRGIADRESARQNGAGTRPSA